LAAVQFDNQLMFDTAEVRYEISYWYLTPELDADQRPISQKPPELALRFRHFSPQAAGAIENYGVSRRFGAHFSSTL